MSVYRCDYIVYGYKIPYDKELARTLKLENNDSYPYWDGGVDDYLLTIDDIAGQYIVFGKVLYANDYYANEAENNFMNFEEIDVSGLHFEELEEQYAYAFGEYPPSSLEEEKVSHIY